MKLLEVLKKYYLQVTQCRVGRCKYILEGLGGVKNNLLSAQ
jgi:hypothetical protein